MIIRICVPAGIALFLVISILRGNAAATKLENENSASDVQKIVENMTVDEKVGQMLMPDFRNWKKRRSEGQRIY